jgi:hypothetical protein
MSAFKLDLRNKSVDEIISLSTGHITSMTGNADYPAPTRVPTDAAFAAGLAALQTARDEADAAETIWKQKNAIRDAAEDAQKQLITARANNCEAVTPGNIPALTGTGLPIKGAASSAPALTAPQNVRATAGDQEGEVDLMWDSQLGAVSNLVQYKEHLLAGDWLDGGAVTQSKTSIPGLVPGKQYAFRVRAVGKDGPGPWSDETVKRSP